MAKSEASSFGCEIVAIPQGWSHEDKVRADGWRPISILTYQDGTRRFAHVCDRGERGTIACAPTLSPGHRIESEDPLTIAGSLLCPDCGTHGFVLGGSWRDA